MQWFFLGSIPSAFHTKLKKMDRTKDYILQNLPEGCPVIVVKSGRGFESVAEGCKTLIGEKGTYFRKTGYKILSVDTIQGGCNAKSGSYNGFHGYDSFDIDEQELKEWNVSVKNEGYWNGRILQLNPDYSVVVVFLGIENNPFTVKLENIVFVERGWKANQRPKNPPNFFDSDSMSDSSVSLHDWDFVKISDSEIVYKFPHCPTLTRITNRGSFSGPADLPYYHLLFENESQETTYLKSAVKSGPGYIGILELTDGNLFWAENLETYVSLDSFAGCIRKAFSSRVIDYFNTTKTYCRYTNHLLAVKGIDEDSSFIATNFNFANTQVSTAYMFMESFSFNKKFDWVSEEEAISAVNGKFTKEDLLKLHYFTADKRRWVLDTFFPEKPEVTPISDQDDEDEEQEEDLTAKPEEPPITLGEYYWDSKANQYVLPHEFDSTDGTVKCLLVEVDCTESESNWIGGCLLDWKKWAHLKKSDFTSFIYSVESWESAQKLFKDLAEYSYQFYVKRYPELIAYAKRAVVGGEQQKEDEYDEDEVSQFPLESPLAVGMVYQSSEYPFFISLGRFDPENGMHYGIAIGSEYVSRMWAGGTVEDWETFNYQVSSIEALQAFVVNNWSLSFRRTLSNCIQGEINSSKFTPDAISWVDAIFSPSVIKQLEYKEAGTSAPPLMTQFESDSSLSEVQVDDFFLFKRR